MDKQKCPKCGSNRTFWKGWLLRKNGSRHILICRDCCRQTSVEVKEEVKA